MKVTLTFDTDADIGDEVEALNYALDRAIEKTKHNIALNTSDELNEYWLNRLKRTEALKNKLLDGME